MRPNDAQDQAEGGPQVVSIDRRGTTAPAIDRKSKDKLDFCLKLKLIWCQKLTQNLSSPDLKYSRSGWNLQANDPLGWAKVEPEVVSIDRRDTTAITIDQKSKEKPDFHQKVDSDWKKLSELSLQNLSKSARSFDFAIKI